MLTSTAGCSCDSCKQRTFSGRGLQVTRQELLPDSARSDHHVLNASCLIAP